MALFKRLLIAATLALAFPSLANASGLLELGAAKKKQTIVPIGTVPVKEKTPLKLGALRTGEAQLPGGLLSRSERMNLRAKLALKRQQAVSKASRKRNKRSGAQRQEQTRPTGTRNDEIVYGDDGQPQLQ